MKKVNRKIPKSALALYVQLYMNRNKKNLNSNVNNTLAGATRSWLKLNKAEKLKIQELYNECVNKYKRKFADYLKGAEPFMRSKTERKSPTQIQEQEITNENQKILDENHEIVLHNVSRPNSSDNLYPSLDPEVESETTEQLVHQDIQPEQQVTEPIPPNVKSAKELFELIKDKNEENHLSWSSLTNTEKKRFRSAVLLLKKDYIEKYVKYLNNLRSEDVFQLYVDNI